MIAQSEKSREQLVAELAALRSRLSQLQVGADGGMEPDAPSFATYNPSPVLRFDSEGTALAINPAAAELIGPEAMVGSSLVGIIPALSSLNIEQTIANDGQFNLEADLGGRWFQLVIVGLRQFGVGHVYCYDITDRRRAEVALRASVAEQRRRTREQETLSNIARIIGSSLAINEVYQQFALEVAQLIPFDRIVINLNTDRPGYMVDSYQSSVVEVPDRAPDQAYSIEGTFTQSVIDSRRCVVFQPKEDTEAVGAFAGLAGAYRMGLRSFLSAPLVYRGEPIGCLNLHSLSEEAYSDRHRLLAERIAIYIAGAIANSQLHAKSTTQSEELARSNQELEQFAYVASHDLQEPLRMVASYVALLGRRYEGQLDERADKYINFAVDGATRMQQLIHDLLAYSRVGAQGAELAPTDADAALREALQDLNASIQDADAKIVHSQLPWVTGDPSQLRQLFQNIIGNALKFTADAPPRVEVVAERGKDNWTFTVSDNGIGFEQRYADRIFGVFKRLHRSAEIPGTGIGLAICQRIIDRHGGRIWAESAPGEGTRIHFTLPAPPDSEPEQEHDIDQ